MVIGTLSWPLQNCARAIWSQDVTGRFPSKDTPTFEGCEGTIRIADDIVIFGKSELEHDHHFHGILAIIVVIYVYNDDI